MGEPPPLPAESANQFRIQRTTLSLGDDPLISCSVVTFPEGDTYEQMMEEEINRRTAWRKSAPALEIIRVKMTVVTASHQFDLSPEEIES